MIDLWAIIYDVYDFVEDAQPLLDIPSASKTLLPLVQQNLECAYFIQDYAKDRKICTLSPGV
jgi:hypothetical protein